MIIRNLTPPTHGWARRGLLVAAATTAVLIGSLLTPAAATAAAPLPDGASSETAAGSCWEIKQNYPAAASGVYWLVTPSLIAPEQFYCDQTTDGGGWVLVGRGREAWKEGYNGLRTPAEIRNVPSGTGAFLPAELPAETVDGLLNNARVDALADGVRLRRATDQAGTAWQETRFKFQSRDRWVWTFGAEHRVGSFTFDGTAGSGGQTNNFGRDNNYQRVVFNEQTSHQFLNGFAFGSGVGGSTSATSFLWAPSGQGYARPFTQVFLRPMLKVAAMDFGAVPDAGSVAVTKTALPQSDAQRTTWGVSGFANGSAGELNTEVAEFGQVGSRVFVGGNFQYVQRSENATGTDKVEQRYLAAFDVNSGEWSSSFRPVLNGQVKAIAGLPDGRVAVGGQFSTVNGQPQVGLAFLDPNTGALSGAQVTVEHRTAGNVPYVRDLDVQSGYLYVAGAFTHLTRVGSATSASTWNGGRINLGTGSPDTNWNAFLNGTSVAVDASDLGDRAYFSGYFKMKQSTSTPSAAALQSAAGAPLVSPLWVPSFSNSGTDANGNITGNVWQLGVAEAGGKVWLGGSEHSLIAYDRSTFQRLGGSITKPGGDFQTVEAAGDLVFGGCHCGHWVYQDAYRWSDVGTGWSQADKINLIGAWSASTGKYRQDWSPVVQARAGYGAWGSFTDSTGTLWVGGDFSRSVRAGEVLQWSGGFIRFAPRDTTAPTAPGATSVATGPSAGQATLTWGTASDSNGVTYEVVRENRVIASTTATSYVVPVTDTAVRYFVRARDPQGNRSASTAAAVVAPLPDTALAFVQNGEPWQWRFNTSALPSDWNAIGFDASAWSTGSGLFGLNVPAATTNINQANPSPRPLSAQFRKQFNVSDPATVVNGTVTVIANDGAVVYLNGTELGRSRLPAGTITQNTYANAIITHAAASANRVSFTVPSGLLVNGTNVIAASVHANYRSTPDLSFDLAFTAERGQAPVAPGAVTGLTATSTAFNAANVAWQAPASGTAPAKYVVARDGVTVIEVAAPASTFSDTGLTAETTYEYTVTAVSAAGLASPPTSVSVTTQAEPVDPGAPVVIENGAEWSYRYSGDALPAEWNSVAFDDSAWAKGVGVLARGVAGSATNIDPAAVSPRPLSAQFRKSFAVIDATTVRDGTVTVVANDGVVVYLNGVELGRTRLPAGALTQNSYANGVVSHAQASADRSTFTVPASLLVEGTNVISASVHANYRNTPDLSYDLTLTMPR